MVQTSFGPKSKSIPFDVKSRATLRCEVRTPLGFPVLPEVNIR